MLVLDPDGMEPTGKFTTPPRARRRPLWLTGWIVWTVAGLATMVVSAGLGWGAGYVLGALAAAAGLWALARPVAPRLGPAVVVLLALVAVGLPAYQAWRLHDGNARWSVDRFPDSPYLHTGGVLENQRRPVVIMAADGSWRNLDAGDFIDYQPDDPQIRGIAPSAGALVMTEDAHAFWYRWAHDVPTPLLDRLAGYDTWQVDAMTESAVVLSGCPEDEIGRAHV